MMVQVLFAIMALVSVSLLLYFLMPMLHLANQSTLGYVDEEDPINELSRSLGDTLAIAVPVVGIAVVAFLLLSQGLKRDAFD